MATKSAPGVNTSSGKDTKILPCTCQHPYQDSRYGKGQRVFNPRKDGFTCTVCGTKRT